VSYHAKERSLYSDWPKVWRNWVANAGSFGYPKKAKQQWR
jgi:hypothetical protein